MPEIIAGTEQRQDLNSVCLICTNIVITAHFVRATLSGGKRESKKQLKGCPAKFKP